MNAGKQPPSFSFDLTRADGVVWSRGGKDSQFGERGTSAGFFIDDMEIADEFASRLPPLMADLVDIASAVHTADRLAVRTVELNSNWCRRLEIKISVRCPEMWTGALELGCIERLLGFLTEDTWQVSFVPRRDSPRGSEVQEHLFAGSRDRDVEVSLFSGGLDSFAGTADRASDCSKHLVLVSASPNPQQRARQQRQVKVLREQLTKQISHVCVPYGIHHGDEYAQEPSRRTRGFLFLILGGVTALLAGSSALYLYENGIGAINLPYDQSQLGTDNARAVHPRVLRKIGEILSLVGNQRFSIENRCIYKTKAEMLQKPAIDRVKSAIPYTFSCDGFPVRAKGRAQCGFCTSCLLRRHSLERAGLANLDSDGYLQDWKQPSFRPARHHLRGLRAMDWQVFRLEKCFSEPSPWQALTFEFPELQAMADELSIASPGNCTDVEPGLTTLLRQHAADWRSFSALRLLET